MELKVGNYYIWKVKGAYTGEKIQLIEENLTSYEFEVLSKHRFIKFVKGVKQNILDFIDEYIEPEIVRLPLYVYKNEKTGNFLFLEKGMVRIC